MPENTSSFVAGAAVLGASGLLAKIAGAFYRIPLANILGTEGSGYYGMVYPVFSALAAISTLGIPTAISRLVAEKAGCGDLERAVEIFSISRRFLLILGLALWALFLAAAHFLAQVVEAPPAVYSFMAVSPAFIFVSLLSSYRGLMQGFQQMKPTAVSQTVEQIGKLGLGLSAAGIVMRWTDSPALASAGALLGMASSEGIALGYMIVAWRKSSLRTKLPRPQRTFGQRRARELARILRVAVPITIGACMMPVVLSLDSLLVSPALQAAGMSQQFAASQVGILTMNVAPLVNLPTALSGALAMSVVPALACSAAEHDDAGQQSKAALAMKTAVLVGLPCAAGYAVLSRPILALLFHSLTETELNTASDLLRIMSVSVLLLVLVQAATGILQGVGRQMQPVLALLAGAVLKAGLTPSAVETWGVSGAAWTSVICFSCAFGLDIFCLRRSAPFRLTLSNVIAKPVVAALLMTGAALAVYMFLNAWSSVAGVVCAVAAGALVYLVFLCRSGSVMREEFAVLPGGRRLAALGDRLHWWPEEEGMK